MDDLKRRSTAIMSKADLEKLQLERKDSPEAEGGSRLTRLKAQQIASGKGLQSKISLLAFKVVFTSFFYRLETIFK